MNRSNANQLTGSVMPDAVSRSIFHEVPHVKNNLTSVINEPTEHKPVINDKMRQVRFILTSVILEGNKLFTTKDLLPIYQKELNTNISIIDLFAIVQNITNFYRNQGYILSQAILPPQHIKHGIVHIKIIEGFLDKIKIAGKPFGAKYIIETYAKEIVHSPPLNIKRLEKYLIIINEIPGATSIATLSPAANKVGASDLNITSNLSRSNGSLAYDNYGTRYIGPQELTATIQLNSSLLSGDSIKLNYVKTPKGKELTYTDVSYVFPINKRGTYFNIGHLNTNIHPLFVLTSLDIAGTSTSSYATLDVPIIRSLSNRLTFETGFYYNKSSMHSLGTLLYQDKLRVLQLLLISNFLDRFTGTNLIRYSFKKGLPILGYSNNINPATAETSRPGGYANFSKLTLQWNRLQIIKSAWSISTIITSQLTFKPLLSGEQFLFGGNQLGRGYDVAELTGDKGLAGSLELRYHIPLSFNYVKDTELYTFYDIGVIWNFKNTVNIIKKQSAASSGFGARFVFTRNLFGNLMWAKPLTKMVAAENIIHRGKCPRIFFSIILTC